MSALVDFATLLISLVTLGYALRIKLNQKLAARNLSSLSEDVHILRIRLDERESVARDDRLQKVNHDLRTHLTSILGFCALLRRTSNELSPKQAQMLENINRGARQMLEVVGATADWGER